MREASSLKLVALLVLALFAMPVAAADEAHADCEATQPWIGYRTTDGARATIEPALAQHGLLVDACEGEQWDGQDGVQPDTGGSCSGTIDTDPDEIFAALCEPADPNAVAGDDPTTPLRARLSTRGASEAYVATSAVLLARTAVYVGTCGEGEPGLEGEASCGGTRELRIGIYVRDDTPGDLLWGLTPPCLISITGHCMSENDCSQATYQYGAYDPPSQCMRDNTAIGARIVA